MTVAVVGSREFKDKGLVYAYVDMLPEGTVIVSGGAEGPDTWAVERAKERLPAPIVHLPDWDKHKQSGGRKNPAGMIRNKLIVADAGEVVAFWDGKSSGTLGTIRLARKIVTKVYVDSDKPVDLDLLKRIKPCHLELIEFLSGTAKLFRQTCGGFGYLMSAACTSGLRLCRSSRALRGIPLRFIFTMAGSSN